MSILDEMAAIEIPAPITNETPLHVLLSSFPEWERLPTVPESVIGEFLSPTSQAEFSISGKAYSVRPILTSSAAREHFLYVQSLSVLSMDGRYFTNRHGGDSQMLLYTLSGCGRFSYGARTAILRPGDGVWIDCAREHRYQTVSTEWTHIVLHFRGASADALFNEYANNHPLRFHKELGGAFQACFEQLFRDYGTISYGRDVRIANRISNLLTMLIVEEDDRARDREGVVDDIQRTIAYLEEHLAEPITLDHLADHVHLSKFYLSHEFKRVTGYAPVEYLIDLRINQARLLLATTMLPIADIAAAVGVPNGQYFGKLFKRRTGLTPGEYRRQTRS